jgi:hypothetical protein
MRPIVLAFLLACSCAFAQQSAAPAPPAAPKPLAGSIANHSGWPEAKPEEVRSIDAIVGALYDVISGPQGKARDWDRMRSLFLPDARLIPTRVDKTTGKADAVVLTIEGYIERSSPLMASEGFFERGVHNLVEQYGNIAHVWSTYESRHGTADAQPFARGINSIQLLKSGDRYYIVQVLWDSERPGTPLPEKYLGK